MKVQREDLYSSLPSARGQCIVLRKYKIKQNLLSNPENFLTKIEKK